MKFMEMTTKDLDYNLNLVEKSSSRLQRINSVFKELLLWVKTLLKGTACSEKSVKGRVKGCGKLHCLLFRYCPTHPNLSRHHPDQSADIDTETRPSTNKKILTCEDRDDAQTSFIFQKQVLLMKFCILFIEICKLLHIADVG